MRHALVAVLLAFVPCLASAGDAPAIDPPAYDTVVPELFQVDMEKGRVKSAVYIEPYADGMVKIVAQDGSFDYVPMYRIKSITDQDGNVVTRDVLILRRNLGSDEGLRVRNSWMWGAGGAAGTAEAWKPFRFIAAPGAACGSYLISDFAAMFRNHHGYRTEHYFSTDVGFARNLGSTHSLGGTVFLGAPGTYGEQVGVRLRAVSWLSRQVSLDISPGAILWENDSPDLRLIVPGLASQASLNVASRMGIVFQLLSANRKARSYWYYPYPYEYRYHQTDWQLGVRFGGELGVAGAATFLAAEALDGRRRIYGY